MVSFTFESITLMSAILVFSTYLLFIIARFGVLPSISESYYALPQDLKPIFILVMLITGGCIVAIAKTGLLFFSGTFFVAIGVIPLFKDDFDRPLHYASALLAILLGFAALIFNYGGIYFFIAASMLIVFLWLKNIENFLFWLEIICFYTIGIGILVKIVNTI